MPSFGPGITDPIFGDVTSFTSLLHIQDVVANTPQRHAAIVDLFSLIVFVPLRLTVLNSTAITIVLCPGFLHRQV